MSLSQAIVNSEVPMRRTNALLKQMGTTLANTARWQLSSSMLHGFMGAVQSAYGYAQDLNESLNNIRIVTGQNIEQMAKFAEQANKAAKALSTTTTEYTNASLIYYQQGLNEQQVKERTDITIKMANVSRQSAEIVSDQMTAVWNNFYKGGKSLEYYADVMTALGAATASSTQEISDGLEKFAAIADTVGLSYEYAAAALATVTATTRQSADVVGTAFKTLFARIQDLELGKTLDDGTDLGKYSQALNAVGINIKDVNGDMKSMDAILDELGTKW
jgi:TP901 family phage tail tape measure protein